jgi:hypothetical protein
LQLQTGLNKPRNVSAMPEMMHMGARRKQTVIRVDVNVFRNLLFEAGKRDKAKTVRREITATFV